MDYKLFVEGLINSDISALSFELTNENLNFTTENHVVGSRYDNVKLSPLESKVADLIARHSTIEIQDEMLKNCGLKLNVNGCTLFGDKTIVISPHDFLIPLSFEGDLYFLVFGGFHCRIIALYNFSKCRYLNYLYSSSVKPPVHNKPVELLISRTLIGHLNKYKFEIFSYMNKPSIGQGCFVGAAHMGHSLWNDLSGLERINKSGLIRRFKNVVLLKGTDPFDIVSSKFKIDYKFGIVKRSNVQWNEQVANFYYNNLFWLRVTDNFIDSGLRDKLTSPKSEVVKNKEISVVFGLRVENRTWTNQYEGWLTVMRFLSQKYEKVELIIDGHNSLNGEQVKSSGEAHGSSVVDEELKIVKFLEVNAPNNVTLTSCILTSLLDNLNLMKDADFFIAPWGAGLAKYSWALLKPGLVLTSQWNYDNRLDLSIYNDEEYLDSPPAFTFIVGKDDNNVNQIVESELDQKMNFEVDIQELIERLERF